MNTKKAKIVDDDDGSGSENEGLILNYRDMKPVLRKTLLYKD